MIRAIPFVAVTAFMLVVPGVVNAEQRPATGSGTTAGRKIDGDLRFLSHELLQGRVVP
jgi:hypothetical protein